MMTASPAVERARRRQRDRGVRTRRRILDAARRLFSARGFSTTTVRDIAGCVGITDAAIYHHFSSKREMLSALLRSDVERLPARAPAAGPTDLCAAGLAARISAAAVDVIDRQGELFRMVVHEALAGDAQSRARYDEWLSRWEDRLAALLAGACVPSSDAQAIARSIVCTVAMAAEDIFILRRDSGISRRKRLQLFEQFVRASAERSLAGTLRGEGEQPALSTSRARPHDSA